MLYRKFGYVSLLGGINQFMELLFELVVAYAKYAARLQSSMNIRRVCIGRLDVARTSVCCR